MQRYKNYDDWLQNWQSRVASQRRQTGAQDPIKITPPTSGLDYPLRKVQEPEVPLEPSPMDQNALYDFLGNALWGYGETYMDPTVADIAMGGKLSQAVGSQPW